MPEATYRPRVGFLGTGPQEIQLLLELRAGQAIDLVGAYDADPDSPGLAMAAVVGVPVGSDAAVLERMRLAEFIVLPEDRLANPNAVRWAAGLHAELVSVHDARARWAGVRAAPGSGGDVGAAEEALAAAVDASARLQDRADLADWLLAIAMRAVGANGGSIQLLAAETSELYIVAARGLSERLIRHGRHHVGQGVSGMVAATGSPQIVNGPRQERPSRERGEVYASMSFPLEDQDVLLGVLNVSSTVRGRVFGEEHLRALERLAPRIARLLHDASRLDPRLPRLDVPRLLRQAETSPDLPGRLRSMCERAGTALGADSTALYVASEDGDWLRVAASSPSPDAVPRAELDAAFLERRWVHAPGGTPPEEDAIGAAIERALELGTWHGSRLVCPLEGVGRVGVLVLEFRSLEVADRCLRTGGPTIDQLGFCIDSLLREHRQMRRIAGYTALTRSLQRLVGVGGTESIDRALAAEAAQLVGAGAVSIRRVHEAGRTYSRPVVSGTPPGPPESWRELDARTTERTLAARRATATTVEADPDEPLALASLRSSIVSVPFEFAGSIVAVLNAYQKESRDMLEPRSFSIADRQLLEDLAIVAARLLGRPAAAADEPAATPEPARDPPSLGPGPDVPGGSPPVAPPEAVPSPVAPSAATVEDALALVLGDAATAERGVGVWVLRFAGLSRLGAAGAEARSRIASTVRLGLRADDVVAWTGEEELTIVGPGLPPSNRRLEARLSELVRPLLARLSRGRESSLDLRIGASAFPHDGRLARDLLAAAADRAR